jgi:hypothetical protein
VGQSGLDGVDVDRLSDGQTRSDGGVLDSGDLVAGRSEDAGQEDDQERLDAGGDLGVLGDGTDGVQGLVANGGILLVVKLLLERLNRPVKSSVSRVPCVPGVVGMAG